MATIEAEPALSSARSTVGIERLEAAALAAWPPETTLRDGSWIVGATAGLSAKRLNSLNTLDPSDDARIDARLAWAARVLDERGQPMAVRETPLSPPALIARLGDAGWERFTPAAVLTADLGASEAPAVPQRDDERDEDAASYTAASLAIHERDGDDVSAMRALLSRIAPTLGLHVARDEAGSALAVAISVSDGDLVGILDLAVAPAARGTGLGRAILARALDAGRRNGARTAWLQVEIANDVGRALFASFGFAEAYRYAYHRPPEAGS